MNILQTIDLKKYYGTEPNITRALNGVNFTVVAAQNFCQNFSKLLTKLFGKYFRYL